MQNVKNYRVSRITYHNYGGFTLIEMLIVIAVIGVLAVAVLSAINPVEQMRKARDTRRRSNAAELMNALERHYTTNEEYPTSVDFGANCAGASRVASDDLTDLVPEELKPEFQDRIDDTANYLYAYVDTDDLAHVCYQIEAVANQSLSDCDIGTITSACVPE